MSDEDFHPTLMFGFLLDAKGEQELCQMFVSTLGNVTWRPVPMVEMTPERRKPAVAGYVDGDGDDSGA